MQETSSWLEEDECKQKVPRKWSDGAKVGEKITRFALTVIYGVGRDCACALPPIACFRGAAPGTRTMQLCINPPSSAKPVKLRGSVTVLRHHQHLAVEGITLLSTLTLATMIPHICQRPCGRSS